MLEIDANPNATVHANGGAFFNVLLINHIPKNVTFLSFSGAKVRKKVKSEE